MKLKLILLLAFVLLCNNVQSGTGEAPVANTTVVVDTDVPPEPSGKQELNVVNEKQWESQEPEGGFAIEADLSAPVYPNAIYVILSPVANLGQMMRDFVGSIGELGRSYAYQESKPVCGEMLPQYQCELSVEEGISFESAGQCQGHCEKREARCCQYDTTGKVCTMSMAAQEAKLLAPEFDYYYAASCEAQSDKTFKRQSMTDYCGQDANWKTGYMCDRVQWYHSSYVTDLGTCAKLCQISKVQGCCYWDSTKFRCGVSKRTELLRSPAANADNIYYCAARSELPKKLSNVFQPRSTTEHKDLVQVAVVKHDVQFTEHTLQDPNVDNEVQTVDIKKQNFVVTSTPAAAN